MKIQKLSLQETKNDHNGFFHIFIHEVEPKRSGRSTKMTMMLMEQFFHVFIHEVEPKTSGRSTKMTVMLIEQCISKIPSRCNTIIHNKVVHFYRKSTEKA